MASATCEMFAYNVASQQMADAAAGGLVLGSDYMLIAGLGAELGKEKLQNLSQVPRLERAPSTL